MANDGWVQFNDTELFNLSRTVQLSESLGIDAVWTDPDSVAWIQTALGGVDYDDITEAPWYDAGFPASAEFAGLIPLSLTGLDDSTLESSPREYITDGGNSGRARNATLTLVANVAVVASTERGAVYGKHWLDRLLRGGSTEATCSGADLTYFQYAATDAPTVHRRNVKLTRGTSVTRKRSGDCSVTWLVTFTLNAADPYEYGEGVQVLSQLGGAPEAIEDGAVALVESGCPVYNYDPIYDPLHPALVESPTAPDFLPDGWGIEAGMTFDRFWAKVQPLEPSSLLVVPRFTLTASFPARTIRVSVFSSDQTEYDQCDALFSAVITYLPSGTNFIIDGEAKAVYAWGGWAPNVRRADSLVYSADGHPLQWTAFNDPEYLIVTLDIFSESGDVLDEEVRLSMELITKSD